MEEKKKQIVDIVNRLLRQNDRLDADSAVEVSLLAGDGSQRQFFRVMLSDNTQAVAVLPPDGYSPARDEAKSAWLIGNHLYRTCVPVPEPIAYDQDSGLILFEDLGDVLLFDAGRFTETGANETLVSLYTEVVRELAHMQISSIEGFDVSWCWQTPCYDRQLMLERESGYFYQSLCRDFFNLDADVALLYRDFHTIADNAAAAPSCFFLHRDFQSRNIMVKEGKIRIIDFQGGRLGPLGYDLASLLIDPYMNVPVALQETLIAQYVLILQQKMAYDADRFMEEYLYLSLQRNLQILGAFAFLGKQCRKTFFLPYIKPALFSLQALLAKAGRHHYPELTRLLELCLEKSELYDN